jgi:hypothetical protein
MVRSIASSLLSGCIDLLIKAENMLHDILLHQLMFALIYLETGKDCR